MKDLANYNGIRTPLPLNNERIFRITLCFFMGHGEEEKKDPEHFSLRKYIEDHDPGLLRLLQAAYSDLKAAHVRVYLGDPDEELEEKIEMLEKKLKSRIEFSGYLVLNRSAELGMDDSLPQSEEEWEEKAGEFVITPQIRELFDFLNEEYMDCTKLT